MRLARVAVIGVAAGAGLLAAFLAVNMNRPPPPVVQQTLETVDVLVATKDIGTGTKLARDMLKWERWPKAGASAKFMTRQANADAIDKLDGALVRSTFYAGEPIVDAKLILAGSSYMSAILPQGKRAIATRVAADTSAGGFILPNDRVDVIMTRQGGSGATPGGYVTETILSNVRVLAIDQTIEEKDGKKVVVGQTATLELAPQQAEILTVAQQMGDRMTLALRSLSDAKTQPDDSPDATYLIGGEKRDDVITVVRRGAARQVGGLR